MSLGSCLRPHPEGALLSIKLQPRASSNSIDEVVGDALKIRITAPPVDSAANEELVRFLAQTLDCHRNKVELVRGHKSRHKIVLIRGLEPDEIRSRLKA